MDIVLRCDEAIAVDGVDVICIPQLETDLEPWQADWLNLVVDGREHLIALRSSGDGQLHQAVWSGSAYLSWVYYSGLSCEIILDALLDQLQRGANRKQLQATVDQYTAKLWTAKAPGRKLLIERVERQRAEARQKRKGR